MKLSIIIVNYNVKQYLKQAIESIHASEVNFPYEIIVVDNASSDGSVHMVKETFPTVSLIASDKNLGFSAGNNLALRKASGEYCLLFNPDAVVFSDTLQKMIDFLDNNPAIGAAGCKILNPDGTFQLNSRRSIPTIKTSLFKLLRLDKCFPNNKTIAKYNMTYFDPDETREVEALMGAFFMIRKKILDEIGLLDETFFMYGEDIDLSYRIAQAGWKVYYFSDAQVIHHYRKSSRQRPLQTAYVFHTAMAIFYRKHFQKNHSVFINAFIYWAIAFRMMLFLILAAINR